MQPDRTFERAYSPQHKDQRVTVLMQGARLAASDGVRREPTRPATGEPAREVDQYRRERCRTAHKPIREVARAVAMRRATVCAGSTMGIDMPV
jgi:hypothetical protein